MFQKMREKLLNENEMYLGNKKIEVTKLTPAKWKRLFGTIDTLPGLIVQILVAPQENFYMTVVQAIDIAMDEVIEVVSILTEVDSSYIKENVGIDELIEYLAKAAKRNRLDSAVKNLKSLLPEKR